MSKNGGPSTEWATSETGSKPFDVEPGEDSYLFCIQEDRDVFACVTVKSSFFLITPREPEGDEKPDITIDFDFISDVKVDPSGYSAEITYKTEKLSMPAVLVSKKSPLPFTPMSAKDEEVFDPSHVESSSMNLFGGLTTSHGNQLVNLDPGTTYHYVIKALDDSSGLWFREKGSFKTLKRNVSVTFQSVTALDDSDDLSSGDFTFAFYLNGGGPAGWPKTEHMQLATGSSKELGLTGTLVGAPASLDLEVVGYDDDEIESVLFADTCGTDGITGLSGEGQSECGEWTTAANSFDLGPNVDAWDPESFTKSFTMVAVPKGDDSEVSFKVKGSYSVSFK